MLLGKSSRLLIPIAVLLVIVVLAVVAILTKSPKANTSTALTKTYANAAYGFIVKMPEDFAAYPPNGSPARDENGKPTGQALVLQNHAGAAVQIEIAPDSRAGASNVLAVDDVEQMAPYLDLSRAEPLQIAPGISGVTFTDSEHPSYGSSTDEVWFAYRGNLYQVIADAKFHDLFQSMMATWSFI
jgi:hypothetical protein